MKISAQSVRPEEVATNLAKSGTIASKVSRSNFGLVDKEGENNEKK